MVLLHGFGGGACVWQDVMAGLPETIPVIAYDLPGHGGSLQEDGIGGAGRMAKAVLIDLKRRGVARCHVAGHSLGGATAALMALREPTRVKSLTLLAPGGFGPEINHRALAAYGFADSEAALQTALRAMTGPGFCFHEEAVRTLWASRQVPGAGDALRQVFEAILAGSPLDDRRQGTLPLADLGRLAMPCYVVWGLDDTILPVAQAEGLPANITVERIAGAGHMLIDECPERVLSLLRAVLAQVP
nr:alpha/beta fold hydrolase [Rhizobium sp. CG5]